MEFNLPKFFSPNFLQSLYSPDIFTAKVFYCTVLNHLLAFVQLPWQVDSGWFRQFLTIFFMEFINIGLAYIRGGRGGVGGGKSLNKEAR